MQDDFKFFRGYYETLKKVPASKRGKIYEAICSYVFDDAEPNFGADWALAAMFESLKISLDKTKDLHSKRSSAGQAGGAPVGNQNAAKRADQLDKNKQNQPKINNVQVETSKINQNQANSNKNNQKQAKTSETEKQRNIETKGEKKMNKEERKFLSHEFAEKFPNRNATFPATTTVPDDFSLADLFAKMDESSFLSSCDNLGLAWCLGNYKNILAGNFRDFTKPPKPCGETPLKKRGYTKEERDAVFDNFNEIEF